MHLQRAAHFLVHFFAVVLHNYNVKFPSYTFYLENVLVFLFAFFTAGHFHVVATSISYILTAAIKFSCLSSKGIRLLYFFISLPSYFSAIHVSVDIKI